MPRIAKHIKAPFGEIGGWLPREETSLQINLRSLCMQTIASCNEVRDPTEPHTTYGLVSRAESGGISRRARRGTGGSRGGGAVGDREVGARRSINRCG
ncbi:unnamed protein product, partial [Iphiclides podalirius]